MPVLKHGLLWPDYEKDIDANYRKVLKGIHMVTRVMERLPMQEGEARGLGGYNFIQAGGHVGLWAMELSNWGNVFVFEPEMALYDCLVKNTKSNARIECYQAALGDGEEDLLLYQGDTAGTTRVIRDNGMCNAYPNMKAVQIRIDGFGIKRKFTVKIDAILLDIEGYEYQALLGATKTLKNDKPVVLIEEGFDSEFKARNFLLSLGYSQVAKKGRDSVFVWSD